MHALAACLAIALVACGGDSSVVTWGTDELEIPTHVAVDGEGNRYVIMSTDETRPPWMSDAIVTRITAAGDVDWSWRWSTDCGDIGVAVFVDGATLLAVTSSLCPPPQPNQIWVHRLAILDGSVQGQDPVQADGATMVWAGYLGPSGLTLTGDWTTVDELSGDELMYLWLGRFTLAGAELDSWTGNPDPQGPWNIGFRGHAVSDATGAPLVVSSADPGISGESAGLLVPFTSSLEPGPVTRLRQSGGGVVETGGGTYTVARGEAESMLMLVGQWEASANELLGEEHTYMAMARGDAPVTFGAVSSGDDPQRWIATAVHPDGTIGSIQALLDRPAMLTDGLFVDGRLHAVGYTPDGDAILVSAELP